MGKICPACAEAYDWEGVEVDGVDYCCRSCATGRECDCSEHSHLHHQSALGSRSGAGILGSTPGEL